MPLVRLVSRKIVLREPTPNTAAYSSAYYTRPAGVDMMRVDFIEVRDDTHEHVLYYFSGDNGRTWGEPHQYQSSRPAPGGTFRRFLGNPVCDPHTGRLVAASIAGVLGNDQPLDGMTQWYPTYRVSLDGGRTWVVEDERMIHEPIAGEAFTPEHPAPGVWIGQNGLMVATEVVFLSTGKIIAPMQVFVLDDAGKLVQPPGSSTYTEAAFMIGTWRADHRIAWTMSRRVRLDWKAQSIRGALEPSVAELPDGRLLCVMRGSNHDDGRLDGRKWSCTSSDGGLTWTDPRPWGYSDGSPFYSPSSYPALLRHSSGRYFWLGNICPENPTGNTPRWPVVLAEIDPATLRLRRESTLVVDSKREDDAGEPSLGNYQTYEDRETREVVIRMCRALPSADGTQLRGHAYEYRIEV